MRPLIPSSFLFSTISSSFPTLRSSSFCIISSPFCSISTPGPSPRLQDLRTQLKNELVHFPSPEVLTDRFGRTHNYLRISITERCNLRCTYCMPESGVELTSSEKLLTSSEIVKIAELFVRCGVDKIRLTGGEPLVRKDLIEICQGLGQLPGIKKIKMTTNGITLQRKLEALHQAGLTGVNISLDTLDPKKFPLITRRLGWEKVMGSIEAACELFSQKSNHLQTLWKHNFDEDDESPVKVNCVITRGVNDQEVGDFALLTQRLPIEVRFIEYMPFDGNQWSDRKFVPASEMMQTINKTIFPLQLTRNSKLDGPNATSRLYTIEDPTGSSPQTKHKGKVGFITSMSDHFCGTCNRLRLTADGNLKVCLFGNAEVSLRDIIRKHYVSPFAALHSTPSSSPIPSPTSSSPCSSSPSSSSSSSCPSSGRSASTSTTGIEPISLSDEGEKELFSVIQMAVQKKKAQHAGMYKIAEQKNRPMILIGG